MRTVIVAQCFGCTSQVAFTHGLVLLFLASGLAVVAWRWRHARPDLPPPTGGPPRTFPLGPARPWVTLILLAATLAVVGPPIAALLARLNLHAVTPHDLEALRRELLRSLWMAALGAALVVLPAVGLAHGASGSRGRWSLLGAALILLLSLPAPVVGISLIGLLNRPGPPGWLYDSPLAVVAGYYVRFLPVGLLLLTPAVLHVPRDLVAAARMDGCTWLGVQRHVVWPAVWPAALTVWLIVVILCFGEIGASVLLQAPGAETFSIRAFTLLHFGVYHDLALLALLASLVIALLWLLLWGAARYTLRLHAQG
jgi:ABC-type Fe3+ transport system permease subunit